MMDRECFFDVQLIHLSERPSEVLERCQQLEGGCVCKAVGLLSREPRNTLMQFEPPCAIMLHGTVML